MLSLIIGAITGLAGLIAPLVARQQEIRIELAKVQSDVERNKLLAEQAELAARHAVLMAEAGSRINSVVRVALAFGPILYIFKVFAFDKVTGSIVRGVTGHEHLIFKTDPLDDNLWKVVVAVIAFYLVYDIAARFRK